MKLTGHAKAEKVAFSRLAAGLCPSQQQEAMTWSVFVAHPVRAFPFGFPKAALGRAEERGAAPELLLLSLIWPSCFALQIFGPRSPGEVPRPCSSRHRKGKAGGTWNMPGGVDWALPAPPVFGFSFLCLEYCGLKLWK